MSQLLKQKLIPLLTYTSESQLTNAERDYIFSVEFIVDLKKNKSLSFFYHHFRSYNFSRSAEFEQAYRQQQLLNTLLLGEYEKIEKLFRQNKINYLPVKGLVNRLYYENPDIRDLNDLDIFVPEKDLKRAALVLCEEGYHSKLLSGTKLAIELFINHASCFRSAAGLEIDLHWKFAEAFCLSSNQKRVVDLFWKTYQNKELEWIVLQLIIQAKKNHFAVLSNFTDYLMIAERNSFDQLFIESNIQQLGIENDYLSFISIVNELNVNLEHPLKQTKLSSRNHCLSKMRYFVLRHLVPFGPDLDSRNAVMIIFLRKYLRLIYRGISSFFRKLASWPKKIDTG